MYDFIHHYKTVYTVERDYINEAETWDINACALSGLNFFSMTLQKAIKDLWGSSDTTFGSAESGYLPVCYGEKINWARNMTSESNCQSGSSEKASEPKHDVELLPCSSKFASDRPI